jgi:RNA polymerase-binding protein DksA
LSTKVVLTYSFDSSIFSRSSGTAGFPRRAAYAEASMDQEFIQSMRESLIKLKTEIIENLMSSNADFRSIVEGMDPKDFADIASDDIDRKMIEAIGSQDIKRLKAIENAITRIQQGKYGLCMKCNKKIPRERLQAIPYAVMCIECKSDEERRNR